MGTVVVIFRVWRHLLISSERFLRRAEIGLTVSGRLYLWRLLQKGAATVVREGKENDVGEITRAQDAAEQLLATAAGISPASSGPGMELGIFLGAVSGPASRRISAADLKLALRYMCPLWPFCE